MAGADGRAACSSAQGRAVELVTIRTAGDRLQERPLSETGGKGLFVKEIEDALLRGDVDVAVHSAKDMSVAIPAGLVVAAVLPREDPRDALVLPRGVASLLAATRAGIGTGSVRRIAQLAARFRTAQFLPMRGNVDTRLRKLDAGEFDALVLAVAGLSVLATAIAFPKRSPTTTASRRRARASSRSRPARTTQTTRERARRDRRREGCGLRSTPNAPSSPRSAAAASFRSARLPSTSTARSRCRRSSPRRTARVVRGGAQRRPKQPGELGRRVAGRTRRGGRHGDPEAVDDRGAMRKTPCVFIVGAGPGDPGLISVRGQRHLEAGRRGRLRPPGPPGPAARRARGRRGIDVGAAAPRAQDQDAISLLLVEKAREGKTVVRLKWGDPFVFDSGGKEALFLHEQQMPFEVIPGIPATIGVPAYAGIPVTYPGAGDTLTLVRGHEAETDEAPERGLGAAGGTGRHARVLRGRPADRRDRERAALERTIAEESAALIYAGTTPAQETAVGTLATIAKRARRATRRCS